MANKQNDKPSDKGKEDRIPTPSSPTPNAVLENEGATQDAKNPATVPYVEPMMQVTNIPNTYPPQDDPEAKTNEEATLEKDRGPHSVENTKGLERDPQHAGIVHSQYGHDRIETEAEKAARRGDAGVNLGQPGSINPGEKLGSNRLSAEQEAGRKALDRKHSPKAKEDERTKGAKKK